MLFDERLNFKPAVGGQANDHDWGDRRRAQRKAVFLRATVYPIDTFCDVRVWNVSATGAMGEADIELVVGQIVHISVDEHSYYPGKVRWLEGRRLGLDIPQATEVFSSLIADVDHGAAEGHHPRAERVPTNMSVRLLAGRPPRPAIIRNLSETGMLLDTSPGLQQGQQLVVRAGSALPTYGRIQWVGGGKLGLRVQQLEFAKHILHPSVSDAS